MTDERRLVQRMQRGDQQAFDEFFEFHAPRIAAFAARRCALDPASIEDVVQQTMINAIRGLATFRGDSSLFTWLCRICRNQLADARRKAMREPQMESFETGSSQSADRVPIELTDFRDPLDECSGDSTRSAVRRAVNDLSPRYARVLELRYGDELTVPEIARLLQISDDAAESLIVRAKKAFRDRWTDDEESTVPQPSHESGKAR